MIQFLSEINKKRFGSKKLFVLSRFLQVVLLFQDAKLTEVSSKFVSFSVMEF